MYLWIVIVSGIFCFITSMGIGANDAANAFATSIGSKALTIKQAVVLAAIFETAGAILMGSHVTDTIRKGIADYKCFEDHPEILMYGCMWVIFSVGVWLFMASKYEMPVSTTHSVVGGMIGMTIVLGGWDCVIWYEPVETFPYIGGVGGIIMSWFLSPLCSAIVSCLLFYITRSTVLRKDFNSNRLNWIYPILIGITIIINTFFIIYKGAKGLNLHNTPLGVALGISFGLGTLCALLTIPLVPRIKKYVKNKFENTAVQDNVPTSVTENTAVQDNGSVIEMTAIENEIRENQDVLNIKNEVELNRIVALHTDAEKFNDKTEEVFKYLQVFTAICDSFSHGANDVANSIGPFAVIYTIYTTNELSKETSMGENSYWILGVGGIGIAVGLMVYGYKIIRAIGEKLCKITPARGAIIELSSSLVVIIGSRLNIPLSTTHCQIGATTGIGFLENPKSCSGINGKLLAKIGFGWLITCVIVGLTSALLTAQGSYAPSLDGCTNYTS